MGEYLRARDVYEQGAAKRRLIKALSTHSGLGTLLVTYYDPRTQRSLFSNFPPSEAFVRDGGRRTVLAGSVLSYQALHRSYSLLSGRTVASLRRDADFDDDTPCAIYVERSSGAPDIVRAAARSQGVDYVLVQFDAGGVVRYSGDPALVEPLSALPMDGAAHGTLGGHHYVRTPFAFGGGCAVLAPADAYAGAARNWMRRAALGGAAALALVMLAALALYRSVFRSLSVFKREIDRTIAGDLESPPSLTGVGELDQLLRHFDAMKRNIKRIMREDAERTERLHAREREMLIYQINPHFLFNTLNALHWLAAMAKQPAISRYVSNLSAILSYNLGRGQPPTLRTELSMLELYIEIEQARHDFTVVRDVPEGPHLDVRTPRLILQPIVENAIGHGMDEGGTLTIRVAPEPGGARAVISDDGCGIDEAAIGGLLGGDGSGVGLRYVRAALTAQYGERARIEIARRDGGGTEVSLWLPEGGEGADR